MQAVILAGGFGTRLSEETAVRPKPMVEIGERPILWHIMKIYSAHGINDFIICCGYKGHIIKDYFCNYFTRNADMTVDLNTHEIEYHNRLQSEPWRVTLVDTGDSTMTGGRLRRVAGHLKGGSFCFTYGDGVGNVDIKEQIAFHESHGKLATMTAVQMPGRFGAFTLAAQSDLVARFHEKPTGDGAWINGGFFILRTEAIRYIEDDSTVWEREPLERLARDGELCAYRHPKFWHPMDTLRDKAVLEDLWMKGKAPWKVW